MESDCFSELYMYFSSEISISDKNKKPYVDFHEKQIPLPQFQDYSLKLLSNFIGEYSRNLETYKDSKDYVIREITNYKFKFNMVFPMQFGFDFEDPEKYFNLGIYPKEKLNEHLAQAMKVKWVIFHRVNEYLDKEIEKRPDKNETQLKRQSITIAYRKDFWLKMSDKNLVEFYDDLKEGKFIADTSIDDFINAFTGLPSAKINWIGGQHSLHILFQELNNNNCFIRKLNHGKWEIVSKIFVRKNSKLDYFPPEKLKHSRPSKNNDYSQIKKITEKVIEMVNEYKQKFEN